MNLVCYPFIHVKINEEEAPDAPNSVVLIYNMYRASLATCNLFSSYRNKLIYVPSMYYCTGFCSIVQYIPFTVIHLCEIFILCSSGPKQQ